jgi:hypothetical protein
MCSLDENFAIHYSTPFFEVMPPLALCRFFVRGSIGLLQPLNRGHAECAKYMRSFNVLLLLLSGGGYTKEILHGVGVMRYECMIIQAKLNLNLSMCTVMSTKVSYSKLSYSS